MTNKRRVTALVAIACAVIIATGGLVASNMGFKLNYPLTAATTGVSKSGTQTIGLPYNKQVNVDYASQLLADIVTGGVSAVKLEKYNPVNDQNDPYPPGDFTLVPGESYLVGVTADKAFVPAHY